MSPTHPIACLSRVATMALGLGSHDMGRIDLDQGRTSVGSSPWIIRDNGIRIPHLTCRRASKVNVTKLRWKSTFRPFNVEQLSGVIEQHGTSNGRINAFEHLVDRR